MIQMKILPGLVTDTNKDTDRLVTDTNEDRDRIGSDKYKENAKISKGFK